MTDTPRTRRRHRLEPITVHHEYYIRGHDKTTVLHRCSCGCGKLQTSSVQGIWTLEQVKGLVKVGAS